MLIRDATDIMLNESLKSADHIQDLISPLNKFEITGIAYHLFNEVGNNKIRNISLFSNKLIIENYLKAIHNLEEKSFVEFQEYPLNKSSIFSPNDERYCIENSVRKLDYKNGIKNSICISIRDFHHKRTELFWFLSDNDTHCWFPKQIDNLKILNEFILYFKDKMQKRINNPMLSDKQQQLISNQINKVKTHDKTDTNVSKSNLTHFDVQNYFLGYPFNQSITWKEFLVLKYYFLNYSSKEIADILNLSSRTIEKRLEVLLSKTNCKKLREFRKSIHFSPIINNLCNEDSPNLK